jgi:hypothetical protein
MRRKLRENRRQFGANSGIVRVHTDISDIVGARAVDVNDRLAQRRRPKVVKPESDTGGFEAQSEACVSSEFFSACWNVGMLPMMARAQVAGAISGVVRDTQGGVIPGVTVEASSPVLIEKVRSAVTDSAGR